MNIVLSSPMFGMFLTIITFIIGSIIKRKCNTPLANPLLISIILSILFMKLFGITFKQYLEGGRFFQAFLVPVTAVLGLSIYRQKAILKQQFLPIFIGCLVGSLLSIGSVLWITNLFKVELPIVYSLLPKSVTTAIALDLSEQLGGIRSITVLAVLLTGISGAVINPALIKLLKIKDKVAIGVAMGTASHAVGTAKAIEMGEIEGAISGVSMGITGLITVVVFLFL